MSESGPYFNAWTDDADRVDAFAAAASALFHSRRWDGIPLDQLVLEVRADFAAHSFAHTGGSAMLRSGNILNFDLDGYRDRHKGWFGGGPLQLSPDRRKDLFRNSIEIAVSTGPRSTEDEATILAILGHQDIVELLMYLCVPDYQSIVITGVCSWSSDWGAPTQACATYHADAASIARDLALSWLHIHGGNRTSRVAGTPLEELATRIRTAPRQARILVASGVELSREAVLEVLSLPPGALLDALEASALPDEEWRAAEPRALETIEAAKEGVPTYEVNVSSRKHLQFIERHAPYRVQRLANGGVLLSTHPYRMLWPLYADALFLLGITP